MRRVLLGALAVAPVLFSIVANLATSSMKIPPSWNIWIFFVCFALGLALIVQTYREFASNGDGSNQGTNQVTVNPVSPSVASAPPVNGLVLDGGRRRNIGVGYAWLATGVYLGGMTVWIAASPGSGRRSGLWAKPTDPSWFDLHPVGAPLWIAGCFLMIFVLPSSYWFVGRDRGRLEFTSTHVTFVQGRRVRISIPWSDIARIEVQSGWLKGTFLAAFPVSGSTLLTTASTMAAYDPKIRAVRVCDLLAANIPKHAVEAALQQWRPSTNP